MERDQSVDRGSGVAGVVVAPPQIGGAAGVVPARGFLG
jgi:hypothetical protein